MVGALRTAKAPTQTQVARVADQLFAGDLEMIDLDHLKRVKPAVLVNAISSRSASHPSKSIAIPGNLASDTTRAWMHKLAEIQQSITKPSFERFWSLMHLSFDKGSWKTNVWAPAVLPSGALLIRNARRLFGLSHTTKGSLRASSSILKEQLLTLERWSQGLPSTSDLNCRSNNEWHPLMYVHRDERGFSWTTYAPQHLSEWGQTLIFVTKDLLRTARRSGAFGAAHFVHDEVVWKAASESS